MQGNKAGPLRVLDFPAPGVPGSRLQPLMTTEAAPYHDALREGVLMLQVCGQCGKARLPGFPRCPWCREPAAGWQAHAGGGRVHSWTRYHRAFMSEFEALLPYAVAAVELDHGPVLIGRVIAGAPQIGMRAQAVIEAWPDGLRCIAFALEGVNP